MHSTQLIIQIWQETALPVPDRSATNLHLVRIDRTPRASFTPSRYYLATPSSIRRLTTWCAAQAKRTVHINDERTPLGMTTSYWFHVALPARLREWYHDAPLLGQQYPPHVAGWKCAERNPESILIEAGRHMHRPATLGDIMRLGALRERSRPTTAQPCTHLEAVHLCIYCTAWEHFRQRIIDL